MRNYGLMCYLIKVKTWFYAAVSAKEGDAYPLGALPVGTLVNNLEIQPGKGSEYIRAAGWAYICYLQTSRD